MFCWKSNIISDVFPLWLLPVLYLNLYQCNEYRSEYNNDMYLIIYFYFWNKSFYNMVWLNSSTLLSYQNIKNLVICCNYKICGIDTCYKTCNINVLFKHWHVIEELELFLVLLCQQWCGGVEDVWCSSDLIVLLQLCQHWCDLLLCQQWCDCVAAILVKMWLCCSYPSTVIM